MLPLFNISVNFGLEWISNTTSEPQVRILQKTDHLSVHPPNIQEKKSEVDFEIYYNEEIVLII